MTALEKTFRLMSVALARDLSHRLRQTTCQRIEATRVNSNSQDAKHLISINRSSSTNHISKKPSQPCQTIQLTISNLSSFKTKDVKLWHLLTRLRQPAHRPSLTRALSRVAFSSRFPTRHRRQMSALTTRWASKLTTITFPH